MSHAHAVHVLRLLIILSIPFARPAAAELAAGAPMRLHVSVGESMVSEGRSTPLVISFLDRDSKPVMNDRHRTVRFEILDVKGANTGSGAVLPPRVVVPGGSMNFSDITFAAKRAGTVLIRAVSDGLVPAEVLVRVSPGKSSRFTLFPVLHAQALSSFQLLHSEEPVPLNGLSTARMWISMNTATAPREPVTFRVSTEPAVSIRCKDANSVGAAFVTVEKGQFQAEFQILAPTSPRSIAVRAKALPGGEDQRTTVAFVAPRPAHVGLEAKDYTVNPHESRVALTVQLLDGDRIPLSALGAPHDVTLETDSGFGSFDPPTVTLSPTRLRVVSDFYPPAVRFGGPMTIFARLDDIDVAEAQFEVRPTLIPLLTLAILGGFLGGVARHVYRVGTAQIWPRRTRGRLDPGLVGNALFSAFSGLVLFQAIDLGVLHYVEQFDTAHGSASLAFVLGVVGGFAGIVVFERLTERVLGKPQVEAVG